jgi:hypothetical protein
MSKPKWGHTEGWKIYFPDDDPERECPFETSAFDAEHAAQKACEHDYGERDGWERDMRSGSTAEFVLLVVAPDGTETRFAGCHEASVEHHVREMSDGE